MAQKLIAILKQPPKLIAKLTKTVIHELPELEDLEVIPSGEEQKFKSNKYGYNEVTVKAVESEKLEVTPQKDEQVFEGMFNKVTVDGVDVPEINDASYLFYNGARTNYLDTFLKLCKNVVSTSYMFGSASNITDIDLSNFDTKSLTIMDHMFYGASGLTSLDLSSFDTTKITDMQYLFANCTKLVELDISGFDTSNVTNMNYIFNYCRNLKELDLSKFNLSKVINIGGAFYNCTALTTIRSFKNLGEGYTQKTNNFNNYKLDLSRCTLLTYDSLIDIIKNGLYDLNLSYNVANGGTLYRQSLVLGSTNKAKLTAEEIAIATNKGWNVS